MHFGCRWIFLTREKQLVSVMSKMNARRSLTIDIPQPNIQNYGRLQEEAEPASETPAPPVYRLRKQNSNESIRRQRPNSNEGIPINGCQRLASADSTQSLNSGNGTQRHSSQNSMDRGNLDGSGRFPRPVNWWALLLVCFGV